MESSLRIVGATVYRVVVASIPCLVAGSCIAPNPDFIDPELDETEDATDTDDSSDAESSSDTSAFQRDIPPFFAKLNTTEFDKSNWRASWSEGAQFRFISIVCSNAVAMESTPPYWTLLELDHHHLVEDGWKSDGSDLSILYYDSDSKTTLELPHRLEANSSWNLNNTQILFPLFFSSRADCGNLGSYALFAKP